MNIFLNRVLTNNCNNNLTKFIFVLIMYLIVPNTFILIGLREINP